MRFEVPQFINLEDKLFGPFTFRQSIYLVGAGGMIFLLYKLLPLFLVILIGLPVATFSGALVFYKPNGRPFIKMVEAFILYIFTEKFYLWRQDKKDSGVTDIEQIHKPFPKNGDPMEDQRGQKLSDLAWSLDILDYNDKN